jgi:hypothetical protein
MSYALAYLPQKIKRSSLSVPQQASSTLPSAFTLLSDRNLASSLPKMVFKKTLDHFWFFLKL